MVHASHGTAPVAAVLLTLPACTNTQDDNAESVESPQSTPSSSPAWGATRRVLLALLLAGHLGACSSTGGARDDTSPSTVSSDTQSDLDALAAVEVIRGGSETTVNLTHRLPSGYKLDVGRLAAGVTATSSADAITISASEGARLSMFPATLNLLDDTGSVRSSRSWTIDVRLSPGSLDPDFANAGQLVDSPPKGYNYRLSRQIFPFASGDFLFLTSDYSTSPGPSLVTRRESSGARLEDFDGSHEIYSFVGVQPAAGRAIVQTLSSFAVLGETGPLDRDVFATLPTPSAEFAESTRIVGLDGTFYQHYYRRQDAIGSVEIIAVDAKGKAKNDFGRSGRVTFSWGDSNAADAKSMGLLPMSDGSFVAYISWYAGHSGALTEGLRRISARGEVGAITTLSAVILSNEVFVDASDRLIFFGFTNETKGVVLARATADGALDGTFGTNGITMLPRVSDVFLCALVPYPNGTIIGRRSATGESCRYDRLDAQGQLDPSFALDVVPTNRGGNDAVLVNGRRLLVHGRDPESPGAVIRRYFL